jgi:hypothetical protein
VRYTKEKLALFFIVQTIAISVMISICRAGLQPACNGCEPSSGMPLILATALILGELGVLAVALRTNLPVWHALVGLGLVSLSAAFVCGLAMWGMNAPKIVVILAGWHVVTGVILFAAGLGGAVWDLIVQLARRDDGDRPDNRQPTAMWPLD